MFPANFSARMFILLEICRSYLLDYQTAVQYVTNSILNLWFSFFLWYISIWPHYAGKCIKLSLGSIELERCFHISFLGMLYEHTIDWMAQATEICFLTGLGTWSLRSGVIRLGFSCGFSPWLGEGQISLCVFAGLLLCACLPRVSSNDTSQSALGLSQKAPF